MNLEILSSVDKEIIKGLYNHIKEYSLDNLTLFLDYNQLRQRQFEICFHCKKNGEVRGGSVETDIQKILDLSLLFKICDNSYQKYSDLIIDIVLFLLNTDLVFDWNS
jgi:hypothetical protein